MSMAQWKTSRSTLTRRTRVCLLFKQSAVANDNFAKNTCRFWDRVCGYRSKFHCHLDMISLIAQTRSWVSLASPLTSPRWAASFPHPTSLSPAFHKNFRCSSVILLFIPPDPFTLSSTSRQLSSVFPSHPDIHTHLHQPCVWGDIVGT